MQVLYSISAFGLIGLFSVIFLFINLYTAAVLEKIKLFKLFFLIAFTKFLSQQRYLLHISFYELFHQLMIERLNE